ncbi:PAS domain-containing protein [Catalinimonas niigatensis]|uniref:PAS domain-containing protein n=1 Tax=Catalinimonas niigatensis TaxID=1397264 RepID=UPI002666D89A|nr:PAS domain-containing protein [Catalinimonas niigatensis]WPP49864.1 PAS domain-containing protein [Catalinimonas niigatensis]
MRLFPFTFVKKSKLKQIAEEYAALQSQVTAAADFISEIEKGNLEAQYDEEEHLSEKATDDQLSNSLISLRKQMVKVSLEERQRNWVAETRSKFIDILRSSDNNLKELAEGIICNLVKYLSANQGGLYLVNDDDANDVYVELLACYAYERKKYISQRIEIGHGLVGQIILEKESMYLTEIPENYLKITSGLGQSTPRYLLIVPLKLEEKVFGAIEIASFHPIKTHEIEFTEQLGESIASTISNVKNNYQTRRLLEETQQQAEEMRAQEEEVRQNMEELSATQEDMQRIMKEVQGNEAFMKGLIDSTNDSIITIDKDYKIITCNKSTSETYKTSGLEVGKGFDIFELFQDEQKAKYKAFYDRALKGEFFEVTEKYQYGDRIQHFTVTYSPLRDEKGEIVGAACFGKDVTEMIIAKEKTEKLLAESQQQAEEMKAQEEELLQNMEELSATQEEIERKSNEVESRIKAIDESGFASIEFDLNGNIIIANANFLKLMDYQLEDIQGKHHRIFVTDVYAESEEYKQFWEMLKNGKSQNGEYERLGNNNKRVFIQGSYSVILDHQGRPKSVIKLAADITAAKQTLEEVEQQAEIMKAQEEEMMRMLQETQGQQKFTTELLNASKENIFVIDKNYQFLEFNKTFEVALSHTGIQAEKGGDVFQVFAEEEKLKHKELYDQVFKGEAFEVNEYIKAADAYFVSSYNPLTNAEGEVYACAVFAKDITELVKSKKQAEGLLHESQQQGEELKAQEEELRQNMEELSATQEDMQRIMTEVQASEHYLNELLNVTKDTIYTLNKEAKIMTFNTFFVENMKQYGFKVEKGFDYLSILPSEEEKKSQKQIIDKVFAGETIQIPLTYEVEGGEIHLVSTYSPIKNAEGKIIATAVYSKDVTELVLAKKQQEGKTWK